MKHFNKEYPKRRHWMCKQLKGLELRIWRVRKNWCFIKDLKIKLDLSIAEKSTDLKSKAMENGI